MSRTVPWNCDRCLSGDIVSFEEPDELGSVGRMTEIDGLAYMITLISDIVTFISKIIMKIILKISKKT
jgi:hypothetical protein